MSLKKKEILAFAAKCMKLQDISKSTISKSKEDKFCMSPFN